MKIIKVVHQDSPELTNTAFVKHISNHFDPENFFNVKSKLILDKTKEKFTELPAAAIGLAFSPTYLLISTALRPFTEEQRRDAFATLMARQTVHELVTEFEAYSEQVEIVSLEVARSKYSKSSNLSLGTYTLHPRDTERLTRLEHYHKNLALEKDDELIILLGRMGAKTLRIIEQNSDSESGAVSLGAKTIFAEGTVNANLSNKIEVGKELVVEFEGKPVKIDPSLLKNSLWFSDDSKLLAIFESRCYNPNKIQKYTLRNTYTESFDFDFDLAAKHLVIKGDLKAEYKAVSKKERFFHIEFG